MTLTTERLREIAEDGFLEHGDAKLMARELLANREAQPVAWEMRYWNSGHNMWHEWERITAEQHAEMSAEHAADNDYEFRALYDAPPVPAVPGEMRNAYKAEGLAEVLKDASEYAPLTAEQWETLINNWHQTFVGLSGDANACRAAMLAQPVSSGYKLVPVEPTEEMLRAAYRESGVYSAKAYRAMLAAAPESVNGA